MELLETIRLIEGSCKKLVQGSDELNRALTHTCGLLKDSYLLFVNGSYATSVFLSITALEETAKTHVGVYSSGEIEGKGRKSNVFFSHKKKHLLAALPTIPMSSRLVASIGKDRIKELMLMARNGKLVALRESALYFEKENDVLVTPAQRVCAEIAKEILLFSIEAFDDALVGLTTLSMEISGQTDEMFAKISAV